MIWMTPGPRMTMNNAGNSRNTSGKTSLMVVFAAASSAFCRRRVRRESEWTRRDCARLVPSFSVWISIATRDLHVLDPGPFRKRPQRFLPGFPRHHFPVDDVELLAQRRTGKHELLRDLDEGGVQSQPRLDADDQQVERVREGIRDLLLALADLPSKHEIREEEPDDSCLQGPSGRSMRAESR